LMELLQMLPKQSSSGMDQMTNKPSPLLSPARYGRRALVHGWLDTFPLHHFYHVCFQQKSKTCCRRKERAERKKNRGRGAFNLPSTARTESSAIGLASDVGMPRTPRPETTVETETRPRQSKSS
jgi:hypothetical protein